MLLTSITIPIMFNNNQDKNRIFGINFKNIIFTISNSVTSMITPTFKQKYLKYKQKYLKLKNIN